MSKMKCPNCGEIIRPLIYMYRSEEEARFDRDFDVSFVCPKCRAASEPRKTILAAFEVFEKGKFVNKQKVRKQHE